jgi:hypothetical protein
MTVLVVVLLAILVVAGLGWLIVARVRHNYRAANRLLPDVHTRAPASWAGAHTPEARLHRRLRDALTSLRQISTIESGSLLQLHADIQQEALAIDDRLIAVAALPDRLRAEPLAQLDHAVTAVEDAVGVFATAATQHNPAALESSVAEVNTQLSILAEVRASLDK